MNIYKILDAEVNRVSEGLRCIEDVFRFCFENTEYSKEAKRLRHKVRKLISKNAKLMINSRNVQSDPGIAISQSCNFDKKKNIKELLYANFKRVQEGLRSIEEMLSVASDDILSKQYEILRFEAYELEKKCICKVKGLKRFNPLNTDLYCLTGEKFSKGRSNEEVVSDMIRGGAKVIQYREKEKSLLGKYEECKVIRDITYKNNVTFIINDDVALVQIVDADGVHIGQDDLPPDEVRRIIGQDKIIGLSTHSPEQGINAVKAGVDYIGVGPIYPTNTKENVCAAVGLEYLDWVVENIDIPFVAIGGIKNYNLQDVIAHGASCIAMVTEVLEAESIKLSVENFKNAINAQK
jgi:thiamine-phosphate pyrophosphorylase